MDLTQHLAVIWRRRWLVLAASFAVCLAVLGFSLSRPAVYRAEAVVRAPTGIATASDRAEDETLFLARTYAALATTRPVLEDALARSGLGLDVTEAERRVRAMPDGDVGFIVLAATGPTKTAAIGLARALTESLVAAVAAQRAEDREVILTPLRQQVAELESQLAELDPEDPRLTSLQIRYGVVLQSLADQESRVADVPTVVTPARADDDPVAPTPRRDAVLALLAALVVNAELAVFAESRSDRFPGVDPAQEITRVTGLPVLAEIPVVAEGLDPATTEAFRALRTNLLFTGAGQPLRSVLVTSVDPGTGKSYCAVGLARSAADLELSVVLTDGDLRRPVLHARLDVPRAPGLTETLAGRRVTPYPAPGGPPTLTVLPAGTESADPSALLSGRLGSALHQLRAGLVVLDSPPAALFADALTMALQCDASVVVVDLATTRQRALRRLVEDLRRVRANPLGIVLNRVDRGPRRAYYYEDGVPRPPSSPAGEPSPAEPVA